MIFYSIFQGVLVFQRTSQVYLHELLPFGPKGSLPSYSVEERNCCHLVVPGPRPRNCKRSQTDIVLRPASTKKPIRCETPSDPHLIVEPDGDP